MNQEGCDESFGPYGEGRVLRQLIKGVIFTIAKVSNHFQKREFGNSEWRKKNAHEKFYISFKFMAFLPDGYLILLQELKIKYLLKSILKVRKI